jgi:hypothetical protein
MPKKLTIYKREEYWGGYDDKGKLNLKLAEKSLIQKASQRFKGNLEKMAEVLGITTRTLTDKITNHSLRDELKEVRGNSRSQEDKRSNGTPQSNPSSNFKIQKK